VIAFRKLASRAMSQCFHLSIPYVEAKSAR